MGYNSVGNVGVLKHCSARMRSGASELKPQCSHGASCAVTMENLRDDDPAQTGATPDDAETRMRLAMPHRVVPASI